MHQNLYTGKLVQNSQRYIGLAGTWQSNVFLVVVFCSQSVAIDLSVIWSNFGTYTVWFLEFYFTEKCVFESLKGKALWRGTNFLQCFRLFTLCRIHNDATRDRVCMRLENNGRTKSEHQIHATSQSMSYMNHRAILILSKKYKYNISQSIHKN